MTHDLPTDLSDIDRAHLAAEAAPEDEPLRWRVYEALARAELFVLLAEEPGDGPLRPQVFDLDEGPFVLAFDREDRLTAFTGGPAGYASLPGRALAAMLAPQGLGLGLNLGGLSSRLLPPDALAWLVEALADAPEPQDRAPLSHHPLPEAEALATALAPTLPRLSGLVHALYLTEAGYADGHRAPLLTVATDSPDSGAALARMLAEALRFAGSPLAAIDIAIRPAQAADLDDLARVARVLTPPPVAADPEPEAPRGPGLDPDKPPILRF